MNSAPYATGQRVDRQLVAFIVLLHAAALAAAFLYHPLSVALFFLTAWITLQFGLVLGYHRLFSHKSYETYRPLRWLLAFLGTLAAQTGPISWAATHRYHHSNADTEDDPHSPRYGFAWAHLLWAFFDHPALCREEARLQRVPDLAADPVLQFLERRFRWVNLGVLVAAAAAAYAWGGARFSASVVLWVFALRIVVLWHLTFFTNSVAHRWGYRNYQTQDDSRNVWWLGLVLFGDGWHNNHHADPRSARYGHRWYEFDVSYLLLRLMQRVGLVWNLVERQARPVGHALSGPI